MTSPLSFSRLKTGTHGPYRWLTTTAHDIDSLSAMCPSVVVGKYLAITSFDSGSLSISDTEKSDGWESHGGIAYSPCIESVEKLPAPAGYDEWYVFASRPDLGQMGKGNVFEAALLPGQVEVFVNFGPSFDIDVSSDQSLAKLFWQQLNWIRPESYIAENDHKLTFVTRDGSLFAAVHEAFYEGQP